MRDMSVTTEHAVKAAVRRRDGYRCVKCGMSNDDHRAKYRGRQLQVHRTTPGERYAVDGCVTLCNQCHGKEPKRPASGIVAAMRPHVKGRLLELPAALDAETQAFADARGETFRKAVMDALRRHAPRRAGADGLAVGPADPPGAAGASEGGQAVSDFRDLLAAVLLHRDDDLPRLLVADYLNDRGYEYRPALIRHQCETGRVYHSECFDWSPSTWRWSTGDRPTAHAVPNFGGGPYTREDAMGWMPPPAVGVRCVIDRGFVREVECPWEWWQANAPALAWCPRPCRRCNGTCRIEKNGSDYRCPDCRGSGVVPPTDECGACKGEDSLHHCPVCDTTGKVGRVPRPCPATAMPIEAVRLTTMPDLEGRYSSDGFGEWRLPGGRWYDVETHRTQESAYRAALAAEWPGIKFELPPPPTWTARGPDGRVIAGPVAWAGGIDAALARPEQTTAQTAPGPTGPA